MCSGKSTDVYRPTLADLVLAAVTSVHADENGVLQPMAFTEKALEVYLNAKHGLEPSEYLTNTIKWLLKDHALHEIKQNGKYYLMMPRHSMDAFERMKGYYPDVLLIG